MNPPRLFQCPKQILSRPCEGLSDLAIAMFLNGQQQHLGYLIPLVMRDILVFQCLVGRERRIAPSCLGGLQFVLDIKRELNHPLRHLLGWQPGEVLEYQFLHIKPNQVA